MNILSYLKKKRRAIALYRKKLLIQKYQKLGLKVGRNCDFVSIPDFSSEPYLISIGNNTTISYECAFITHDASTRVIRVLPPPIGNPETSMYGTISIGNNCFIGARTTILPNVTIGDNCIIGACSLVNRDIPSNSVAAGNPCRVICTLDEYINKHKDDFFYIVSMPYNQKRVYLKKHFKIN